MITLKKGDDTKVLSADSSLVEMLEAQGWKRKTPKKEVKNVKFSNASK